MARLSLSFLGPSQITIDGNPIELEIRKTIALLAYLAVEQKAVSRDTLVVLLWPDYEQAQGRTVLRQTLYTLNKGLAGEWLTSDRESIVLRDDADLWVDVRQFRELLSVCKTHGHGAAEVCQECHTPLTQAVALYRDEFLSGFTLKDSVKFDEWELMEAENLRRECATALQNLVRFLSELGEYEPAIAFARDWLALDRLHETAHRSLMQLYMWAGDRTQALRQYQECARVLKAEIDAEPLEETTRLFEAIKAGTIPSRPSSRAPTPTVEEQKKDRSPSK